MSSVNSLRYPDPEVDFLNRVISVISVVLRETTLTSSDSTGKPVSMEYEIVKVVSEISEITRLKIRSSASDTLSLGESKICGAGMG